MSVMTAITVAIAATAEITATTNGALVPLGSHGPSAIKPAIRNSTDIGRPDGEHAGRHFI